MITNLFKWCLCFVFILCLVWTQDEDKQHWIHKTNNIGYTRQTTLGTQDTQHWVHKTNNIGYTRETFPFLVVLSVFYVCVVYFVFLRSVYCIQCLQLAIPGCPVGFLCLCCVFCFSSFCVKIHNTNIENRQDNQEWAAVNIGYNTQNEDKQNTQHKHRKQTGQPEMVFYVCVLYFVCIRSVYCIQCLQLTIPSCPVGFLCLCFVFCLSSFCVLYPMFTADHSWLSRRFSKWAAVNIGYNTQNEEKENTQHTHRKLTEQPGMVSCKHWIQYTERRQTKYKTQTYKTDGTTRNGQL
jgi:hypothetical protein